MPSSKDVDSGSNSEDESDYAEWTILAKATAVLAKDFDQQFSAFSHKHCEAFRNAGNEHDHKFHELHTEYLALFESKLLKFLASEDSCVKVFVQECKDSLEDKFCALLQEDENKWFVERMLAALDYKRFHKLMVLEASKRRGK